jgi:Ca2+-binding EF-hand superfamily protein
MKIKMLGILTVSAVLGTALASAGFAQERGRGIGPDIRARPAAPLAVRPEVPQAARRAAAPVASPVRFLERHDSDADGRVSADEFVDEQLSEIDAMFERRDANGDGVISLDEHDAPRVLPLPRRNDRPDRPRPERPEIDREALHACVRETIADYDPDLDRPLEELFDLVDTNGDGVLSLAEVSIALQERAHALFARIDDDGDGYLTEAEVAAHFEEQLNLRRVIQACIDEQLGG